MTLRALFCSVAVAEMLRRCWLQTVGARIAAQGAQATVALVLFMGSLMSFTSAHAKSSPNCRFYIAAQQNWDTKRGFYLDLKGGGLEGLTLALAAGDGKDWRRAQYAAAFAADREYEIRAVLAPDKDELFLDGKLVAESPGAWQPAFGPLEVNYRPAYTPEGDWLAIVRSMNVSVSRASKEVRRLDFDFSVTSARAVALQLFEPGDERLAELKSAPGDTVTIQASVRFTTASLEQLAPLIDPYGQCRYADWPEKVRGDEDLRGDIAREDADLARMPPSPDYDQYGGYKQAGWRDYASGFFHLVRHHNYWWLVSPEGNPCFYLGPSEIPAAFGPSTPVTGREFLFEWLPPREAPWSQARGGSAGSDEKVSFHTCNLIRKYGADWQNQTTARSLRRIKAWGFSGGGKWGAPPELVSLPVLGRGATPSIVRHPDVFDPQVCEVFRSELERQIAPQRDNPRILGWSLGNEWDEIIAAHEVSDILEKPADVPAKRALVDYAVDELYGGSVAKAAEAWKVSAADRAQLYAAKPTASDTDVEKLRCFYEDRYYDFIYRTMKSIDPNHLYFGFWIMAQWYQMWANDADWRLIARHCDVIGYDRYAFEYDAERFRKLEAEAGKPTLCGEYGFPAWYDGMRGFGRYAIWSRDDADAGEMYYRWVEAAAKDPYCVGLLFFVYRDQPITGRGPGRGVGLGFGERYAFGLITETDRPKWAMLRRVREANLEAAAWRVQASAK